MKLYRKERWMNPFWIDCNGEKRLNKIVVFNKEGVVFQSGCGWFGRSNNPVSEATFDCDCIVKRKVDFNLSVAFVIRSDEISHYGSHCYELYIPETAVEYSVSLSRRVFSDSRVDIVEVYHIQNIGVDHEEHHFVDSLVNIRNKFEDCKESVSILNFGEDDTIKRLADLCCEYRKESARIDALSDEELLKEATK